ncbi:hypothetical protein BASA61_007249 [Batrachochytrium salamandrivorans]|nr:hypothetical protein BASA61_007249 [Batrachochytrium salamandrivorans]KAH9249267.1 hypothetical protein BASA81_012994 [Batrachochytrium salamandrivorans]
MTTDDTTTTTTGLDSNHSHKLQLASRLFVRRQFTHATDLCNELVLSLDLLSPDHRSVLLLLMLRLAHELHRWDAGWDKVCLLAGGVHMLPADSLLLGALSCLKAKDFTKARDMIETWLAHQTDTFMDQVASGIQPYAQNYQRIIELYIISLVGLFDFDSARVFLAFNTALAPDQKAALEEHVDQLKKKADASIAQPIPVEKAVQLKTEDRTADLCVKSSATQIPTTFADLPDTSVSRDLPTSAAVITSQTPFPLSPSRSNPVEAVNDNITLPSSRRERCRASLSTLLHTVMLYSKVGQRLSMGVPGLILAFIFLIWVVRRSGLFQSGSSIRRIASIIGTRLLATARMGMNTSPL